MAAIHRLLSQARQIRSSYFLNPSPFQSLHRSLCSSSSSQDPNLEKPQQSSSASVQPVSYPIKPKDPNTQNPQPNDPNAQNPQPINPESWSREDARFFKDFNPVSAVSYGNKVAPLPEDKVSGENEGLSNEEMENERRKIEMQNRIMRRVFRGNVDEPKVPFPALIKRQKESDKGQKVVHDLKEALHLVKANAKRNFDETLEAHVKLAVDLRRTDLALRVAVFAEGAAADEARAAGADLVGGEDLIEGIKSGKINLKEIDKCIAVPQLMPRLGKEIQKKLNRLNPNARDGSVTTEISTAVKEAKKNIKFKKDSLISFMLVSESFTEEALCENVGAFVNALLLAKPPGLKKSSKYAGYVTTFHIVARWARLSLFQSSRCPQQLIVTPNCK